MPITNTVNDISSYAGICYFSQSSPQPSRFEAFAGIQESLPVNSLVDWEVLMRVRWGRIVPRPTGIGRVQSI